MSATFSVITPTSGRPSLSKVAESIFQQALGHADEWLIVEDGKERKAWEPLAKFLPNAPLPIRYFDTVATNNFGNEQRNLGMDRARGSHLLFMDDDDTFVEGIWEVVRRECEATPTIPLLFRMSGKDSMGVHSLVWKTPSLVPCEIGTPCLVLPNVPFKARWGPGAGTSDYEFIKDVCEEIGPPRFVDARICWVKGGLEC